ncbi:MAG: HEAT repeat domain-containing protein [Planctomycetes bacterium]|nr:HEAT repeat domain-containing protein [Planctomycetota bacterium]
MAAKGRRAALAALVLALAVTGALGYALRGWMAEQWLIWRLRSGDHLERCAAARRLAAMRSARAPPVLVELLREAVERPRGFEDEEDSLWIVRALATGGPKGVEALGEVVEGGDEGRRSSVLHDLALLGEEGAAVVPSLARILEEELEDVDPDASDPEAPWAKIVGTLKYLGPAATGPLLKALEHPLSAVRAEVLSPVSWPAVWPPAWAGTLPKEILAAARKRLGDEDPWVRRAAVRLVLGASDARASVDLEPLLRLLADPDRDVRESVVEVLEELGPAAKKAAPALLANLQALDLDRTCRTLAKLDPEGEVWRQALEAMLEDASPRSRARAIEALSCLVRRGTDTEGKIRAAYVAALADADPEVRREALHALWRSLPSEGIIDRADWQDAAAAARKRLGDEDAEIQRNAVLLLARVALDPLGETGAALMQLARASSEPTWARIQALEALGMAADKKRGPPSELAREAAGAIRKALRARDRDIQRAALLALERVEADPQAIAAEIPRLLASSDERLEETARDLLRALGPQAALAVPAILDGLASADVLKRDAALRALNAAKLDVPEAIPRLVSLLKDKEYDGGCVVPAEEELPSTALVRMGAKAVPHLIAALESGEEATPWHCMRVLARIGEPAGTIVPALFEAAKDPEAGVRSEAISALQGFVPGSPEVRKTVEAALADATSWVRLTAVRVLWKVDQRPEKVLPVLEAELRESEETDPERAAWLANDLGPQAAPLVPRLARLLGSRDPEVRDAAVYALGAIGTAARAAASRLEALLELETEARRREPIAEALAKVRGAAP